jgi:hypothetical protein
MTILQEHGLTAEIKESRWGTPPHVHIVLEF